MNPVPASLDPDEQSGSPASAGTRLKFEDRCCSRDPWVDRRCRRILDDAAKLLVERLRPYGFRLLFLSGSGASGEAVGWNGASRFVLSDLDLGAVTLTIVPPEVTGKLTTELGELRADPADPEVTVGFYPQERLYHQVVTPGLVDFVARSCVLEGDVRWLTRFPAVDASSLDPWEAFRLVGNRCRELLRAGCGRGSDTEFLPGTIGLAESATRDEAEAHYLLAKLGEGIGTAWLLANGFYEVDRGHRWERLRRDDVPPRIRAVVARACPFLEAPAPGGLSELSLLETRSALSELFVAVDRAEGLGLVDAYEYDPLRLRDRVRSWRQALPHRSRRVSWACRSRLRGTPGVRELGAAVVYWLALPERPEPDWGDVNGESKSEGPTRGPVAESGLWELTARLLGEPVAPGPGAKGRLRSRLGVGGPST